MWGKKLFDFVTPYKRTLLVFKKNEKEIIATLPAINTAVFFLSNNDKLYIDSMEGLDEYIYIDYQLINEKNTPEFKEELDRFKTSIKDSLSQDRPVEYIVIRKLIYNGGKYCAIELQLADYGDYK
jgi:hypothetical protein